MMVKFVAIVQNSENKNIVTLRTANNEHSIIVSPKQSGFGSSMNGGEALLLALATCYCNDVYREAAKHNIKVKRVIVEVDGEHDGVEGHVMENISYHATIDADASQDVLKQLLQSTDRVAEIQNTLRQGMSVILSRMTINGETLE